MKTNLFFPMGLTWTSIYLDGMNLDRLLVSVLQIECMDFDLLGFYGLALYGVL